MAVMYSTTLDAVTADDLRGGFWIGWPTPPTPDQHLAMLRGSEAVVLAIDPTVAPGTPGRVVGFVTAVGDGVLAASIPCLEVLPTWQGQGIGSELVRRVVELLGPRYMLDLVCDEELVPFYEQLGFIAYRAMIRRDRTAIMTRGDRITAEARTSDPDHGGSR